MNKRNRIFPFITERAGVCILILLLMIMVVIFLEPVCFSQSPEPAIKKSEPAIQIKIPDGLYLYKPSFREEWFTRGFSPLVIVKDKKLIDPYGLVKKIGISAFLTEYVTGKRFNVYVGSEIYGRLSNLDLSVVSMKERCVHQEDEFVSDIRGEGIYEGKALPSGWFTEREVSGRRHRIYGATKIVITPEAFQVSKSPGVFRVTEADMRRMEEEVRKNLVPVAIEHINKRLAVENRKLIGESGSRLRITEAFDLDGNGKKDLVGVYYLSAKSNTGGFHPCDIFFVLWDTGRLEKISSKSAVPSYMLGGVIDIDQDGVEELIMATHVESVHGVGGWGRQIDILRHGPSGWTSIFRSERICYTTGFYIIH